MLGSTHAPLGAASALTTLQLLDAGSWHLPGPVWQASLYATALGILGGLLPDIDTRQSTIAHPSRSVARTGPTLGIRRRSGLATLIGAIAWLLDLPFSVVAQAVQGRLGHRSVTHSLGAAVIFSLTVLAMLLLFAPRYWLLTIPACAGYLSHLAADGLTYSGQPLLWPLDRRKRWLTPPGIRVAARNPLANLSLTAIRVSASLAIWLP